MEIKDFTVSRSEPTYSAMAQAGVHVETSHVPGGAAYDELFRLLGGEGPTPPVISSFGGKGYSPKVYHRDGEPMLRWGKSSYSLQQAFEGIGVTVELAELDTGFREPHIVLSFDCEALGVIAIVAFPIAVERGVPATQFITGCKRDLAGTLRKHCRAMSPGQGLSDISEVLTKDADVDVTVVKVVWIKEDWLKAVVEYDGQEYLVGTTGPARDALAAPIVIPTARIPGKVKFFQKNFNIYHVFLRPEHLDLKLAS